MTARPSGGTRQVAGAITELAFDGLTPGTSYTFTVRATNSAGSGEASAPSNAVTPLAESGSARVPGAATAVSATAGEGNAVITWVKPSDEGSSAITKYTIYASPGGVMRLQTNVAMTQLTFEALNPGTSYTFTIVATNAAGSGSASAASNAVTPTSTTTGTSVPSAPTQVSASLAGSGVDVTWAAPSNTGASAITRYDVVSSPGTIRTTSFGPTQVSVVGLTEGTAYTFTVFATNGSGSGASSVASNEVTFRYQVPSAPLSVTAKKIGASVVVQWSLPASDGGKAIFGYTVTASPGSARATVTARSAQFSTLTVGTSYTFTVVAQNQVGAGAASAPSNAVTP